MQSDPGDGYDGGGGGPLSDFLKARLEGLRLDIEEQVAQLTEEAALFGGSRLESEAAGCRASPRQAAKVLRPQGVHGAAPSPAVHLGYITESSEQTLDYGDRCTTPRSVMDVDMGSTHSHRLAVQGIDSGRKRVQVLRSFSNVSAAMSVMDSVKERAKVKAFADLQKDSGECQGATSHPSRRLSKSVLYTSGIPNGTQGGALSAIAYTASFGKITRDMSANTHSLFGENVGEWFMAVITVTNTVTIGLSTDVDPDWTGWVVVDGFFALAFLGHMISVMCRLGLRRYFLGINSECNLCRDADLRWRFFEFMLVVLAWAEVALAVLNSSFSGNSLPKISIFRLLRLTRIARILRLCRLKMFHELTMMINGAIGGMRTLMWSGLIIALPLYAVAMLMRETLASEENDGSGIDLFGTLRMSCFTLFRCVVGGDCSTEEGRPIFLLITQRYGYGYALVYCATMMFMVFGLFNVIAAIFVENTLAGAKFNHLHQKRQRLLDTQMFAEKTMDLVRYIAQKHKEYDMDMSYADSEAPDHPRTSGNSIDITDAMDIQISPEFFSELRADMKFHQLLMELDISDEDQLDLFETLDVDGSGTIDLEELIIGVRKLRGDARKSDIVGVALIVRSTQLHMNQFFEEMNHKLEDIRRAATRRGGGGDGEAAVVQYSSKSSLDKVEEEKSSDDLSDAFQI